MAATTTVAVGGKGSNPKSSLYVGGLEENVNESILHAAFLPFGDIKDISIPLDNATGKHRGFGFVEYEEKDDAADAVDNMHNAELYGRTMRVNYAQPMKIKGGDKGWSHQPVWADADKYMEELDAEQELDDYDKEVARKQQELEKRIEGDAAKEAAASGVVGAGGTSGAVGLPKAPVVDVEKEGGVADKFRGGLSRETGAQKQGADAMQAAEEAMDG